MVWLENIDLPAIILYMLEMLKKEKKARYDIRRVTRKFLGQESFLGIRALW